VLVEAYPAVSLWAGWVFSALVVLVLGVIGVKLLVSRAAAHGLLSAVGFEDSAGPPIAITSLVCAVVYAVPQSAVLGAILITGFLGGAICTHVRLGRMTSPPQIVSVVLGAMAWGGLYLRFAAVRVVLPLTM
jgi:hypothetical protein